MKIRNMKQVGERVKEIKMKRLFRRTDHYHYIGCDDRCCRVSELCRKKRSWKQGDRLRIWEAWSFQMKI